MNLKLLGTVVVTGMVLLGCNNKQEAGEVNATCSSPETQAAVAKVLKEEARKILAEERDKKGGFEFEESKIRASLEQVQIELDSVRTSKEDPNSSKKFCSSSLKMTIPTTMLQEIEQAGELLKKVGNGVGVDIPANGVQISQYARELNFDKNVNVFTRKDVQYNVQPTDDKKEIFVEGEYKIPVSLLTRMAYMVLSKPELELERANQAAKETEEKARENQRMQELGKLQQEADEAKQKALLESEKRRLKDEKNQAQRNSEVAQENSKTANVKDSGGKSRIAFSEKMGVDVYATGSKWCKQAVDLTVKIDDFSPLLDSSEMLAFIPKLKAPLEGECRTAAIANITVVNSKGDAIGYYKSYKANDWYPEIVEKE
jgi:hypothetical protein